MARMSHREIRGFVEKMKTLGYPRLISMENFRTPNFSLVAEILIWLTALYDPKMDLPADTSTESNRVAFIQAVAQFMATKADIKLNTKYLYKADGYAVKELQKITSVMQNAVKTKQMTTGEKIQENNKFRFDLGSRILEMATARELASEISSKGASLCNLLGKEVGFWEKRTSAIERPLEIGNTEKVLRATIKEVHNSIGNTKEMLSDLMSNESTLDVKIKKKTQELERKQKRLQSLQSVKPAFMEEYELIEQELQRQYEMYVQKFSNLCYLESQLDEYHKQEQERIENIKKMQQRLREKDREMRRRRPGTDGEDLEDDSEESGSDGEVEESDF